jgi:hypothetical protein
MISVLGRPRVDGAEAEVSSEPNKSVGLPSFLDEFLYSKVLGKSVDHAIKFIEEALPVVLRIANAFEQPVLVPLLLLPGTLIWAIIIFLFPVLGHMLF